MADTPEMVKQNDFDYGFLRITAHRPWPLPAGAWFMTQTWHDLLFAHWRVDGDLLRRKVPSAFSLDLYNGQAWLGIIPFYMTNVAPRALPALPWLSNFAELNVRTYVTGGGRPGIYFFSLDAANPLAAGAARVLFHLPYFSARMRIERRDGWTAYTSRRRAVRSSGASFVARYRPAGPAHEPQPGTLEHFLTERYCLYTLNRRAEPCRLEIHHRPWPLQPADLEISVNTMADAADISLPAEPPLLHFAKRQDMVAWPLRRIGRGG